MFFFFWHYYEHKENKSKHKKNKKERNMRLQHEEYAYNSCPVGGVPFVDAEEAWFWFIQAQAARYDGAKLVAGKSACIRPCEPIDIFKVVDRLYRNRQITIEHIRVLKHYGQRLMAPEMHRPREARSYTLWREALDLLGEVLTMKGIVQRPVTEFFHEEQYMSEGTVQ